MAVVVAGMADSNDIAPFGDVSAFDGTSVLRVATGVAMRRGPRFRLRCCGHFHRYVCPSSLVIRSICADTSCHVFVFIAVAVRLLAT
jgi:hypothetical protein